MTKEEFSILDEQQKSEINKKLKEFFSVYVIEKNTEKWPLDLKIKELNFADYLNKLSSFSFHQ